MFVILNDCLRSCDLIDNRCSYDCIDTFNTVVMASKIRISFLVFGMLDDSFVGKMRLLSLKFTDRDVQASIEV